MENNDLISRSALYKFFDRGSGVARLHVADIDTLPAVDAVPVVHARWISVLRGDAMQIVYCMDKCSHCGNVVGFGINLHYCPYCGARMDRKEPTNE